jgi:hypothetical protein
MIQRADMVESYFGYWPEFCDAKITFLLYEAHSSIILGLSYIDSDQGKAADIRLKFSGVSDVELTDFCSENIIDALRISRESPTTVSLEACYGLDGHFTCRAVEVMSLVAREFPSGV